MLAAVAVILSGWWEGRKEEEERECVCVGVREEEREGGGETFNKGKQTYSTCTVLGGSAR